MTNHASSNQTPRHAPFDPDSYCMAACSVLFGKFSLRRARTLTPKELVAVMAIAVLGEMQSLTFAFWSTRPFASATNWIQIDWMSLKISFAVATTWPLFTHLLP